MDCKAVFDLMSDGIYYSARELRYGRAPGLFLSGRDYQDLLDYKASLAKGGDPRVVPLDLLGWNGNPLFYVNASSLLLLREELAKLSLQDVTEQGEFLSVRLADEITKSRIYSEIEGTLGVESVPTTHKRIAELLEGRRKAENLDDIIVTNMGRAIDFVATKPAFGKENLRKLYDLLSENRLDEDEKLLDGRDYRHEGVEIDGYHGCPAERVGECMDSLFAFVNERLSDSRWHYVLPHVCHYYLVYVHPYFDYNGRTARMISLWVWLLSGQKGFPPVVSEAIDQRKGEYYAALRETRDAHNDLTYFLLYIYGVSVDYLLTYQNLEFIEGNLLSKGIVWSEAERSHFKKVLISYNGPFLSKDFARFIKVPMSRQAALKYLNRFVECGLLTETPLNAKTKAFDVRRDALRYLTPNLRK